LPPRSDQYALPPSATLGSAAERSNSDNFCPVLITADVTSDGLVRYVTFTEVTGDAGGSHGQESPDVPDSAVACLFWCAYPITKSRSSNQQRADGVLWSLVTNPVALPFEGFLLFSKTHSRFNRGAPCVCPRLNVSFLEFNLQENQFPLTSNPSSLEELVRKANELMRAASPALCVRPTVTTGAHSNPGSPRISFPRRHPLIIQSLYTSQTA
jgi:hypothetical protein